MCLKYSEFNECIRNKSKFLCVSDFTSLLYICRTSVCIAKLYSVKSIDRLNSRWVHWILWWWITTNVFIGNGRNTNIEISPKFDTFCEYKCHILFSSFSLCFSTYVPMFMSMSMISTCKYLINISSFTCTETTSVLCAG